MPAIVSNVTVPLLGLCDTAISGHLGSEVFLAAIAVGSVMLNVVFWMFGFLRGGTTGLTAIAFGRKDDEEVVKVFYRSLFIAIITGLILIAAQNPLFSFLKLVAGPDEEIINPVKTYFDIRIWGSPALLATMAISGWFVGVQTTFFPMLIAITMNIVNIAISLILVFPMEKGFEGVALGTVVSNWIGFIIAIGCVMVFRKGKRMKFSFSHILHGGLWKYFKVNSNLFLRSFFIICVTMGVTAAGSRLGNLTLAVNVIVMQFFQFFSFFMDGFAYSGEAIVGKRMGENNYEMLQRSVRRLLQWTLATGIIFFVIYYSGTEQISSLITDNPTVVSGVTDLLLWICLIPLLSCWAFIYDGFYIGVTATGRLMISTFLAAITFFGITFVRWGCGDFSIGVCNNHYIWAGFLSYLAVRGIYLSMMWKSTVEKIRTSTQLFNPN